MTEASCPGRATSIGLCGRRGTVAIAVAGSARVLGTPAAMIARNHAAKPGRVMPLRHEEIRSLARGGHGDNAVVTQSEMTDRWFGPEFVAEHRRRYGRRSPEQRQLTYDIAVEDQYAPWRQWLDDQLALLPRRDAAALAGRIWLDEHFWTVNFELAAGAWLRDQGFTVAYERPWDGLTPDWTVLSDSGQPAGFVEVHTHNPTAGTYATMKAWHNLVERIKTIPVAVVLQLAPTREPLSPPEAGTAKKITRELKDALLTASGQAQFTVQGYTFHVVGDPRRGGRQMVSPLGMHAGFVPPSSLAGPVSADSLLEHVEEKVRKYRTLAQTYQVPLSIAVGAHRFTGVKLRHLDDALTGSDAPIINIQFGASDPWIPPQTVTMAPVEPWPMPVHLAELLWIDNQWPFTITRRPNPSRSG